MGNTISPSSEDEKEVDSWGNTISSSSEDEKEVDSWGNTISSSSEDEREGYKDNHNIDKEEYELRYLIKI